jgi:hypothetical protein
MVSTFLSEKFLVLVAVLAKVADDRKAKLFDLKGIIGIMLEEFNQVIHYTFITDFEFITLFELRCVIESL